MNRAKTVGYAKDLLEKICISSKVLQNLKISCRWINIFKNKIKILIFIIFSKK